MRQAGTEKSARMGRSKRCAGWMEGIQQLLAALVSPTGVNAKFKRTPQPPLQARKQGGKLDWGCGEGACPWDRGRP